MLQDRSLRPLILRTDHRRTEAGGLGSVLARPATKPTQSVHRIPDFPFDAGGDDDVELETGWIGGDVLDGYGGPGRSGKHKIDRNRFTKHIVRPHPLGPPVWLGRWRRQWGRLKEGQTDIVRNYH